MAHILAVDDQKLIREMTKQVLEADGHTVELADNPAPALAIAGQQKFDLVICDVNMPGGSGISLVGELRMLGNTQHTPILMMTTESASYRKEKAKAAGASGWLTKPFDPARLLSAVNKLTCKQAS